MIVFSIEVVGMEYDWKNNSLIMTNASKAIPMALSHSLDVFVSGNIPEKNFM
jgi:hypothetical protein